MLYEDQNSVGCRACFDRCDRTMCASLSLPLPKSSATTRYIAGALSRMSEQLKSNACSGESPKLVLHDLDTQSGHFFFGHARHPDAVPDDARTT